MNPMLMNPALMNPNQNFELQNEVTEMKIELDKLKKKFKNELGCCFELRSCVSFVTIMYILITIYFMAQTILEDHNNLQGLMDDRTKNVYNNTNNNTRTLQ
jgi:hypothetical protein